MKRTMIWAVCALTVLGLLAGTAGAASIQIVNGPASLTVTPLDENGEKRIAVEAFQIAGVYEDGSYLVYAGGALYKATAEALTAAAELKPDEMEIPSIEETKTLQNGAQGRTVTNLQIALRTLGYFTGAAGGQIDAKTTAAVKAFQEAVGLESNGTADAVTQLLARAMAEEPVEIEGIPDPEIMFAPILGRTDIDLTAIMESGLRLEYDDFSGEGFISDGSAIDADVSGETVLDKAVLTLRIGFLTRETADGRIEVLPAMKVRCLCVRRPIMAGATVKAGNNRGDAEMEALTVSLDGIYTVEEGTFLLSEEACEALAGAAEAGELKIRITGRYAEFDTEAGAAALKGAAKIGELAGTVR